MSAFWEPYRPKPGDLVRVKVSGECPHEHFAHNPGAKTDIDRMFWFLTAKQDEIKALLCGAVGTVQSDTCANWPCGLGGKQPDDPVCDESNPCFLHDAGHGYLVTDNTPETGNRCVVLNDWFAAVELEKVEAAP